MSFSVRDGFLFAKNLNHPLAESYRGGHRVRLNPDIVWQMREVLSGLEGFDLDFYLKWHQRKSGVQAIKDAHAFDMSSMSFKMPPFAHQQRALAFILNTPAQGLFADPGTGKTYCALVAAETRIRLGLCKKVLVICPASITTTGWYEDLKKFTDLRGIVIRSNNWKWFCPSCLKSASKHEQALKHVKKCGIDPSAVDEELKWNAFKTAPETLWGAEGYDVYITSINLVNLYLDDYMAAGFDFIILDESTMIKSPDGKMSKAVRKLGHTAKYRLAMTGTPVTNELEDIWSQMQFIDMSLDSTIGSFRSKYYWQHPTQHFIRSPKKDAGEKIAELTRDSVLRIKKSDCLDLPDRTRRIREIEPSAEIKKVYRQFYKDFYAVHQNEEVVAFNSFTEILRLHQILNGFWTKKESGEIHIIDPNPPKVAEVKRIIESATGKVIVWANYRHDAALLSEKLSEFSPAVVNGSTRDVESEVKMFLNHDACRVMIAHPKSARFGHTWNVADTTVYYTWGYSVEDYWQSRDRNYRIGQDKSVYEIFLSSGGIESQILSSVMAKEDFSKEIMSNFQSAIRRLVI